MATDIHETDQGMGTSAGAASNGGGDDREAPLGPRDRVQAAAARLPDVADTVRREAADRLPDMVEGVRQGAVEGRRTIQAMPMETQKLLAAFSVGLGLGLAIAGAPRVVAAVALAPAIVVGADLLGRSQSATSSR